MLQYIIYIIYVHLNFCVLDSMLVQYIVRLYAGNDSGPNTSRKLPRKNETTQTLPSQWLKNLPLVTVNPFCLFLPKVTNPRGYDPLKIKYGTPVQKQHSLNTVTVGEFPNSHDTCDQLCPIRMTYKFQIYRYTDPCQLPFFIIRGSASARELIQFFAWENNTSASSQPELKHVHRVYTYLYKDAEKIFNIILNLRINLKFSGKILSLKKTHKDFSCTLFFEIWHGSRNFFNFYSDSKEMLKSKPEFPKCILFQYIALPAVFSIVECMQPGASETIHWVKNVLFHICVGM